MRALFAWAALLAIAMSPAAVAAQTVQFTPGMTTAVSGLAHPEDVAFDSSGNMFIADTNNNVIRRVDAVTGAMTVYAGTVGTAGVTGDAGVATAALLSGPIAVTVDSNGNVYIADNVNNRIRVVYKGGSNTACMIELTNPALFGLATAATSCTGATSTPVAEDLYTVAGPGSGSFVSGCSNGGTAACYMNFPSGLAVDAAGNLYVSDAHSSLIAKLNATTGVMTRYAGTGTGGATAYLGGAANLAKMNNPYGVATDASGGLYITDTKNYLIEYVSPTTQTISVVAGSVGSSGVGTEAANGTVNSTPVAALSAQFDYVQRLGIDRKGNVLISDTNGDQVRSLNPSTGIITTLAGTGTSGNAVGAAIRGQVSAPFGVAADLANNIYIADGSNNVIRKVNASVNPAYAAQTVGAAGASQSFYALLNQADTVSTFQVPAGFADFITGTVTGCTLGSVSASGVVCAAPITFAPLAPGLHTAPLTLTGSGGASYTIGLTGTGSAPQLALVPGNISTAAGNGTPGVVGDHGLATAAELNAPATSVVDGAGTIYVADAANNVVRRIQGGTIITLAGAGTAAFGGDGTPAATALLSNPTALALDAGGDLYIADTGNNRIRVVYEGNVALNCLIELENPMSFGLNAGATSCAGATSAPVVGDIYTVAGIGTKGFTGDAGLATLADLMSPSGVAVDASGNLFVADSGNNRVREVNAATGNINTIAGDGTPGLKNGTPATTAELNGPTALVLDASGNLYIADNANAVVRALHLASGAITTIAGNGSAGYSGDGGAATSASLSSPSGLALDAAGNLYIADTGNNRIRMVLAANGVITTIAGNGAASFTGDGSESLTAALNAPAGVTLDSMGRIYIADTANNRLRWVDTTTSALAFGTVNPQTASLPITATAINIGNQPLTFTNLNLSAGFVQQPSGGTDCMSSTVLSPGQSCNVELVFTPPSTGIYNGALTFTSNSLNQSASHQTVSLSGASALTPTGLSINGLPATIVAGTTGNITVSPVHGTDVVTSYTGTMHFTSSDPKAVLPADYTYTSSDAGAHAFSVTLETAGSQSVSAIDAGNANVTGTEAASVTASTPATLIAALGSNQTVQLAGTFAVPFTAQVLDAYANPVAGVGVVFTAPSSGASGTFSGGVPSAQSTTNVNGNAVAPAFTANTTQGSYAVTASSAGLTSTSFALVNSGSVIPSASLSMKPSVANLVYGQGVTLTATLLPATVNGNAATGTVTFYDNCSALGPQAIGTAAVQAGAAIFTDAVPSTCTHSFSASYSGDSNFATSTSTSAIPLAVTAAAANLSGPSQTPVNITAGQAGTVSVTIAGQFSGTNIVPPTGLLTYQIGATGTPATAPIARGQATLSVPSTQEGGNYSISVSYAGDDNYQSATFSIPLNVNFVSQTLSFASVPAQTYGVGPLALTATTSSGLPVTFKVISGAASITGSTFTIQGAGSITIEADQAGNSVYSPAASTQQTILVAKAATQTALVPGVNSANQGASVTLTATVSSGVNTSGGLSGPGQTVSFYAGSTLLGSAPVTNSGVATFSTTGLPAGQDNVTAQYGGDSNFLASTSSAQTITVVAPNFTFTLPSSTLTVANGQSISAQMTLTAVGGYTGSVAFKCSNLPAYTNCIFLPNPISLTASAPTASVFFTIQTGTPNSVGFMVPLGMVLMSLFALRRKWRNNRSLWLAGMALAVGLGLISGCGGSSSNPNELPLITPKGTTSFTVTATGGAITQSSNYSLTVQ